MFAAMELVNFVPSFEQSPTGFTGFPPSPYISVTQLKLRHLVRRELLSSFPTTCAEIEGDVPISFLSCSNRPIQGLKLLCFAAETRAESRVNGPRNRPNGSIQRPSPTLRCGPSGRAFAAIAKLDTRQTGSLLGLLPSWNLNSNAEIPRITSFSH